MRKALGAHPGRLLYIRTIQHQHFLDLGGHGLVDLRVAEVCQSQHRCWCVPGNVSPYLIEKQQYLFALAVAEVDQEDGLTLVAYEA